MVKLADALQHVKNRSLNFLPPDMIANLCRSLGYRYRRRQLGPVETIALFLVQILHGNAACSHLRHLAGLAVSASAYCQARMRLDVELFHHLLRRVALAMRELADDLSTRFHGHRVFHMDGSSFSMPDTPELQEAFGQPAAQGKGCGFPVAHLLALTDAASGLLVDVIPSPMRTHDMSVASGMHWSLRPGDLLVADRGFCSYAHLALLLQAQAHAVLRIHQAMIVNFRPRRAHTGGRNATKGLPRSRWIRYIGNTDQIVEWFRPDTCPHWMTHQDFAALPESITVRELAYQIEADGYRTRHVKIVTTLLDETIYLKHELAELYHQRWQIETNLRHLKTTMGMDQLRCKTTDGVLKEMLMFALAYNLVRFVMLEAADAQGVAPERISFVDTLRWLQHAGVNSQPPTLIVNPSRPGRQQPRVIKRRPKQYTFMTRPRHQYLTPDNNVP